MTTQASDLCASLPRIKAEHNFVFFKRLLIGEGGGGGVDWVDWAMGGLGHGGRVFYILREMGCGRRRGRIVDNDYVP